MEIFVRLIGKFAVMLDVIESTDRMARRGLVGRLTAGTVRGATGMRVNCRGADM